MKLTVKQRLAAMTICAVTALLTVGIMGVWQLDKISTSLENVNTNTIPSLKEIENIRYQFMRVRTNTFAHIINTDSAKKTELEKRVQDEKKEIEDSLNTYEKTLLSNEEDSKLLQQDRAALNAYYTVIDQVLAHSIKGEDKEAVDLANKAQPISTKAQESLEAHIAFNNKLANQESKNAAASARLGGIISWALIAIGSILTGVIGFATALTILKQLGGEPSYADEVVKIIASGDLTTKVITKAGDDSSLLAAMKNMQETLRQTIGQIIGSVETINTASKEIAAGNSDLSQRTEEQASSLEETASSIEELTSTVRQNADNAGHANQLAVNASDIATKGGEVVSHVVSTMNGINEASRKIVDIISVIDGIAFQTNILALNAAVEAARAGEQGRGFAVVAGEVRNLAQRSAAAAKEIKSLINDSVERVEGGTKQVEEAGKTMSEIVEAVQQVSQIISEISNASQEQSTGIEQVNQAVAQMDQVTQQNAALVEESAAAAESLEAQAQNLAEAVAVFKLDHVPSAAIVSARKPAHKTAAPAQGRAATTRVSTARPLAKPLSAKPRAALPEGGETDEWTEF